MWHVTWKQHIKEHCLPSITHYYLRHIYSTGGSALIHRIVSCSLGWWASTPTLNWHRSMIWRISVVVLTPDSESGNPSSILGCAMRGRKRLFLKIVFRCTPWQVRRVLPFFLLLGIFHFGFCKLIGPGRWSLMNSRWLGHGYLVLSR